MNKTEKKPVTRQETINNYKSPNKTYSETPSQVFGLVAETILSKTSFVPKALC